MQLLFWQIEAKNLAIKIILIDEKNYKDLVIYFASNVHYKPVKVLSSSYFELIRKI